MRLVSAVSRLVKSTDRCGSMPSSPSREPRVAARALPAFTLIELVVVIVLLAIFAAAVAPRFLSLGSRRAESEVQAVASLISAAAMRDVLTSQPIALSFDAETARLSMLCVQAASADAVGLWKQDPIVAPITLSEARIVSIQSGVRTLDPREWRIEFPQIEPREKLTIELADAKDESRWVLILSPTATAAALFPGSEKDLPSDETDLDQIGKEEDSW
jgi:prepilin-type N-terminal cleavage/methylation domain-containing protein